MENKVNLIGYTHEERMRAITELKKNPNWLTLPFAERLKELKSYLNKKRAHPRARSVSQPKYIITKI